MTTARDGGSSEAHRKRIFFRCQRRGFKELDLIFGAFAEAHLDGLGEAGLDRLEALLDASDGDLYAWLRGHAPVPEAYTSPVFDKLKAICNRKAPAWND